MTNSTGIAGNTEREFVDEVLRAMAAEPCRVTLQYLRKREMGADVNELTQYLSETMDADEAVVAVEVHHRILPWLSDIGVVEYDSEAEEASYNGGPLTDDLLDFIHKRKSGS